MVSKAIAVQPSIEEQLTVVSLRLLDATSFFTAIQTISKSSEDESKPKLISYLNSTQFWYMTYAAFQTSLFINIFALVDDYRGCISFQHIASELKRKNGDSVNPLLTEIRRIRDSYEHFRHKIFAHTDPNWINLGDKFDEAGFTWESIESDLKSLDYICQCLIALSQESPLPSVEEVESTFRFRHLRSEAVAEGANQLALWILKGIEQSES
jgi:hypothetical protein